MIAVTPNSTVIWTLPSVCVFPSSVTIAVMVAEPTFSALIVELSITLTISVWSLVSVTPVTAFPSASVKRISSPGRRSPRFLKNAG